MAKHGTPFVRQDDLRKEVCRLRQENDLTQQQVADLLGCSRYWFNRMENGHEPFSTDHVLCLVREQLLPMRFRDALLGDAA